METREYEVEVFEERRVLQQADAPPLDYHDDDGSRHGEMRSLDIAAVVVGTVMALGPLSVFSIFGS